MLNGKNVNVMLELEFYGYFLWRMIDMDYTVLEQT